MSVTTIEWTKRPGTIGETWNPTTGCNKVDRGCKNCYAEIMHKRLQAMGQAKYAADFLDGAKIQPDTLHIPLRWNKPRTVFVNSMSDLFHKGVDFGFICDVFEVMRKTPEHTYLVLTKRPERAVEYWAIERDHNPDWDPPQNLWMGTSANDQKSADERIPHLLTLEGCLRFLSYEPATGPLNLNRIYFSTMFLDVLEGERRLDWVIAGGESGPKAIASDPRWFRVVRDQCKAAGVPFFFKQFGLWHPRDSVKMKQGQRYNVVRYMDGREAMIRMTNKSFNVLDGETWQQFPEPLKFA